MPPSAGSGVAPHEVLDRNEMTLVRRREIVLVAASISKATVAFNSDILIKCLLYGHQLEVIMTDVIHGATDRSAIRALGLLLMDHARLCVENSIHEQGVSD